MKLYSERRDGMIYLRRKIKMRETQRGQYRLVRTVEDTRANYKDILRWADVMGHTIEEK